MEYSRPSNQPDEYVKCPYFPEHELRRSRLPYHIIKCQKNPNAPKLLACPFNYLHRVKPEDREDHMILCEDKTRLQYSKKDAPSYANTLSQHYKVKVVKPKPTITETDWNENEE